MAHSCGDIVGGIEPRHDAVHVVRLPLGRANAEAWDLLDDGERRRAARLIWDDDRNRFVVAHAWLRVVLGQCIGLRPSQICFSVSDTGKPTLSQIHDCDLRFNMAHSGEYALVALSLGREVGVDIEKVRDVMRLGLLRRCSAIAKWLRFFDWRLHRAFDSFVDVGRGQRQSRRRPGMVSGAAGTRSRSGTRLYPLREAREALRRRGAFEPSPHLEGTLRPSSPQGKTGACEFIDPKSCVSCMHVEALART